MEITKDDRWALTLFGINTRLDVQISARNGVGDDSCDPYVNVSNDALHIFEKQIRQAFEEFMGNVVTWPLYWD